MSHSWSVTIPSPNPDTVPRTGHSCCGPVSTPQDETFNAADRARCSDKGAPSKQLGHRMEVYKKEELCDGRHRALAQSALFVDADGKGGCHAPHTPHYRCCRIAPRHCGRCHRRRGQNRCGWKPSVHSTRDWSLRSTAQRHEKFSG